MGLLPDLAVPEARAQTIGEAESAYDLLRSVYSNPALPRGMRSRAAIEALPFEAEACRNGGCQWWQLWRSAGARAQTKRQG
jgi:hypothetical protein